MEGTTSKTMVTLAVEHGALVEVPFTLDAMPRAIQTSRMYRWKWYATHWLAVISEDPTRPAGLKREFIAKAHGRFKYLLRDLWPGAPVEFGARSVEERDGGVQHTRDAEHRYYVVREIAANILTLEPFKTSSAAIAAASPRPTPFGVGRPR